MKALILVACLLAGCAGKQVTTVQRVNVAVPIECQEPTPARPVMPTEHLAPDSDLFAITKATIAEIERREGYEGQLRAALENCQAPIKQGSYGLKGAL